MENRRFILIALFGVVLFFLYQAWQQDYVRKASTAPTEQTAPLPDVDTPPAISADLAAVVPGAAAAANPGGRIRVVTDRLAVEIALTGGELRRVELVGYPYSKKQPEKSLALIDDRDGHFFILQSGLGGLDKPLATHQTVYTSTASEFRLAEGADTLEVPLEYTDASGFSVRKVYRFKRGSYEVDLQQQLANNSGMALSASPYARFIRTPVAAGDEPPFVHTFLGLGFYQQKEDAPDSYRFRKTAFKKLSEEPLETKQTGGWIAMLQHYFAAAILPPPDEVATYSGKPAKDRGYIAQYVGPSVSVADQTTHDFQTRLYIGPKLQESIGKVAPGLELTVDYGILTPISEPLFWLLSKLHKYTGNWGVAIILLTVLVKALFYKLSEAQYRSMAKMKKFAPRIAELKERYGDDRERMSKAMMDLYKKEGFNPLAGCWPLLVQMPVFFALYWVFLESVELRQADFALWITDLTSPDPFYVLPVLYGASMWVMQKLSGQSATMDPMQAKIMNVMPIALTAFFTFFPAGLVLYWLVSNLISIAQQWYITRKLAGEGLGSKAKA